MSPVDAAHVILKLERPRRLAGVRLQLKRRPLDGFPVGLDDNASTYSYLQPVLMVRANLVLMPGFLNLPWKLLLFMLLAVLGVSQASAQSGVEAFDGSFRLSTGEVVTGGYFVEDGVGRFLYMDTERLERGGLFERIGNTVLRSVVPDGSVEIEFIPDPDGMSNVLVWREQGREPIRGELVHPHRSREVHFRSADGTELHGRLLIPECAGPHPVVVSVHGSGPVDRYGGPYQTYFLKHGIAVLAYDKRGYATERQVWREPDLAALSRMPPRPFASRRRRPNWTVIGSGSSGVARRAGSFRARLWKLPRRP